MYVPKYQCKICWQAVRGLMHVGNIELRYNVAGCVLRYCRLAAVKQSEAELQTDRSAAGLEYRLQHLLLKIISGL